MAGFCAAQAEERQARREKSVRRALERFTGRSRPAADLIQGTRRARSRSWPSGAKIAASGARPSPMRSRNATAVPSSKRVCSS